MIGDITAADEIYIVCGYTDMRKSIDGLCAIIEDKLHMDPRSRALYLFCGRRADRFKILLLGAGRIHTVLQKAIRRTGTIPLAKKQG